MHSQTPVAGRRGSALVAALILSLALAGAVVLTYNNTMQSSQSSKSNENYSQAVAAAEYGAELAISQLAGGVTRDFVGDQEATITGDWVYGTAGEKLYRVDSVTGVDVAADQRRITGDYNDQPFRVRVRSARFAHEAGTKPESWLRNPGSFEFGSGLDYEFGDVYEITSTARYRDGASGTTNPLTQAVVRTVVDFKYKNPLDALINKTAAFHNELPERFQPTSNYNSEFVWDDDTKRGSSCSTPAQDTPPPTIPVHNVKISGEDHYLTKYFMEDVTTDKIVTPLKLSTNEANYFGAYGGYWTSGCLTLNYQLDPENANPYRPRTRNFGTGINQQMKIYDSSREPDTYLLGGKNSRTVTLNSAGKIIETSSGQANEGGKFNIVLGAFEDLMNLYINMAGITASNSYPNDGAFADTNQWFRMYIGQYTEYARNSSCNATAMPIYHGNRIRAQTMHTIKNKDELTLVREYEKGSQRYNYAISGGTWKGNYTWADVTFNSPGTFYIRNNTSRIVTPRLFMWQELVGFKLARRSNGQPALRPDGTKRTYFELDGEGKRIPVGFDEQYQKSAASNVNLAMRPEPWDSIWVRQSDGTLKEHKTMDDFLFEKDFGTDEAGVEVKRDALAVFIGYEDQREHQADYNYTDMMFTIYIAPEQKQVIKEEAILNKTSEHWWEREEEEGLTGHYSHVAISTNPSPDTEGSSNLFEDNYNLLGHDPKDVLAGHIYTMHNSSDSSITKFARAVFTRDNNGISTGVLNDDCQKMKEDDGVNVFYYTESDLLDFIQKDPEAYYVPEVGLNFTKALNEIKALNAGINLLPINQRWSPDEIHKVMLVNSGQSAYRVAKKDLLLRTLASKIVGFAPQTVPVVKNFTRLNNGQLGLTVDTSAYPAPSQTTLGFLAGEHLQSLDPADIERLVADGYVPIKEIDMPQPGRPEVISNIRGYLTDNPADAVDMCYVDYYLGDSTTKKEVQTLYGLKENRYSIGFHRAGTDPRYQEKHMQDHFEVVLLGKKGFNPFPETVHGGNRFIAMERQGPFGTTDYEVEFKYGVDGIAPNPVPDFVFQKPIDGAGTMVVNGNLIVEDDFAYHGTMLVLGDVIIRPTLKTGKDAWVYGKDGNPIDDYGHSLIQDEHIADKWYYVWKAPNSNSNTGILTDYQLADDGNRAQDEHGNEIKVTPRIEPTYRGKLVVQGNLLVKGRLITEKVHNTLTGEDTYGELSVYWSEGAVLETSSMWAGGEDFVKRISWVNDDTINVDALWENRHDTLSDD